MISKRNSSSTIYLIITYNLKKDNLIIMLRLYSNRGNKRTLMLVRLVIYLRENIKGNRILNTLENKAKELSQVISHH